MTSLSKTSAKKSASAAQISGNCSAAACNNESPKPTLRVVRLVEKGLVDLNKPANLYLGDSKLFSYSGDAERATILRLLNHTSGVFNVFEHPDFPWVGPDIDYARSWRTAAS